MNNIHQYASSGFRNIPRAFSLRRKVHIPWWDQILDPRCEFVTKWNQIFLVACLVALFIDPLYFYFPIVGGAACMRIDVGLGVVVTFLRTIADFFFIMRILVKFRTAYVAPSLRFVGRRELVRDPKMIATRYLKSDFLIDLAAALPLPQIVIWFVIPATKDSTADNANHTVSLIVLFQYVPRLFVMFPLNNRIIKTTGMVAKTPWSGAAYNLLLYILASHLLGAIWYLLSIQRQQECWRIECKKEMNVTNSPSCNFLYFDCATKRRPDRKAWLKSTRVITKCDARNDDNPDFPFGMFADAFTNDVASSRFLEKYFYCLWWGLKSLSCYGQNIETSTYIGETLFAIVICTTGLVLFAHLIGKVQTYLQSSTARLEEWRVRKRDTDEWMRHRQLPPELQERVRRFVQYKWLATRGVDEETILRSLPVDLRRQIQRHLCLALVRRLLDAICEHLFSSLNTKDTYITREGDPVIEMLFIIRGQLESSTTNGGRSGFFNSITLKPGDFCGEELLTWALMPHSTLNLPLSTRTVKCLTEVEAFSLRAEDLKFVAIQFKRLHSKRLQHAFRYYSHQWRTWGACFIQAAWKRYIRRKKGMELANQEYLYYLQNMEADGDGEGETAESESGPLSVSGEDKSGNSSQQMMSSKQFAASTRRGLSLKITGLEADPSSLKMPKLFKPKEPDFSTD